MKATIAILATLDTKGEEAVFLRDEIRSAGCETILIDVGLHPGSAGVAEITGDQVAAEMGTTRDALLNGRRDQAMNTMGEGAGRILAGLLERGELAGALAIGGNQGTAIAAVAMRFIPFGVPKLIVSTVASGDVRSYVGHGDIAMMFSVADLLGGPNIVTRRVLAQAAGAVVGMAAASARLGPPEELTGETVGVTAFGNTHRGVSEVIEILEGKGHHPVAFHASGASGSAMEGLIDEGIITAVLDYTTHELLGELFPEDFYAPVRPRLTAAGRAGAPQVVVPGGLEYFAFGPPETVPERLRDRPIHHHNPYNMNVRTSRQELEQVGRLMADRLNVARGPVRVLIPADGWSEVGSPGGPLHDKESNQGLIDTLRERLSPSIPLTIVDLSINDSDFARLAADTLLSLLPEGKPVEVSMTNATDSEVL